MKRTFFLVLIFCISNFYIFSQSAQWINDSVTNEKIPIGFFKWTDLENSNFYDELLQNYNDYVLDEVILEKLALKLKQSFPTNAFEVTTIFGLWCSDSREQVPRFMKICDALLSQYNYSLSYRLVGCNREKKTSISDIDVQLNQLYTKVPVFILEQLNPEICTHRVAITLGIIEESPQNSLEKDILTILETKQ